MTTDTAPARPLRDVSGQFPVLSREFGGRPVVYLDASATSLTPQPVIDAMDAYYVESRASVHRGVYPLAVEATEQFEGARERIARWLGSSVEETIFTANATASINTVAYTWGRENIGPGDLVLVTQAEHHSNLVPWQMRCNEVGAELAHIPVLADGRLDMEAFERLVARGPQARRRRPHLQRAGHDQSGRRDHRPRARGRGRGDDRRRPGDPPDPRRPPGDRRRLLRLDRPQGLRPDGDRASCTDGVSCWSRWGRSWAAGT